MNRLFLSILMVVMVLINATTSVVAQTNNNVTAKTQSPGLSLFPNRTEGLFSPAIYTFLERYLHSLLLDKSKKEQLNRLRADFVTLKCNGKDYKDHTLDLALVIGQIKPESVFTLNEDLAHFCASWFNEEGNFRFEVIFPKQYDLILGGDKKELSHALRGELQKHECHSDQPVFKEELLQKTPVDGVFFDMTGTFLIEQMKSGAYVRRGEKGWEYLFNERFREESILNLFSWANRMKVTVPLNLEISGYQLADKFDYDLARLCSFMSQQGCKAYVGIETETKEEITGTVVYVNRDLMFEHLLYFKFPREAFKKKDARVTAVVYPYIPLNNLTNLYDDIKDVEKHK